MDGSEADWLIELLDDENPGGKLRFMLINCSEREYDSYPGGKFNEGGSSVLSVESFVASKLQIIGCELAI